MADLISAADLRRARSKAGRLRAAKPHEVERNVEIAAVTLAERAGWLSRKLAYTGRRGAPDRVFLRKGRIVFIEFKRPGGEPDVAQARELEILRLAGAEAHCVDNLPDALRLLGIAR